MKTLLGPRLGLAVTALAMALSPALAQKTDRLPEDGGPRTVRTIPIYPNEVHSFEERWEPVRELIRQQAARQVLQQQNAPAASAAPLPTPRPAAKVADRTKGLCERHGLRKVITNGGRSWRCR